MAGGKSRKTGGVSKRLIELIKQGTYNSPAKTKRQEESDETKGGLGLFSDKKRTAKD